MNHAIIHASRHGTSEKVAKRIASSLGSSDTYSVEQAMHLDLRRYDAIVLGCSIHAGTGPKAMRRFCERQREALLERPLALFLCCMNPKELVRSREVAYPLELREHALSYELVGGEYLMERMNFLERFLVRKFSGATESRSQLDDQAIARIAAAIRG